MSDNKQNSDIKVKIKLQEVINDNTRPAIGRFHSKELDERGLIKDLLKKFDIKLK